jgi:hypothetical protein
MLRAKINIGSAQCYGAISLPLPPLVAVVLIAVLSSSCCIAPLLPVAGVVICIRPQTVSCDDDEPAQCQPKRTTPTTFLSNANMCPEKN